MNRFATLALAIVLSAGCLDIVRGPHLTLSIDFSSRRLSTSATDTSTGVWIIGHLKNDGDRDGQADGGCLDLDVVFSLAPGPPDHARCNTPPDRATARAVPPGGEITAERFFSSSTNARRPAGRYVAVADVYVWDHGMADASVVFAWDGTNVAAT